MMRLLAAGNRLSDAICRFSSAWMPSVGCRLSVVGCQMRLSRRSDAILSRFVHQSFDVGTRTEITVPVCENGCFSRTGTIPVAPVCTSIVLCENRDSMLISGLAVFRRFCLSGYVDFGDCLVLVLENGPKLRTGTTISAPAQTSIDRRLYRGKFAPENNRARAGRRSRA